MSANNEIKMIYINIISAIKTNILRARKDNIEGLRPSLRSSIWESTCNDFFYSFEEFEDGELVTIDPEFDQHKIHLTFIIFLGQQKKSGNYQKIRDAVYFLCRHRSVDDDLKQELQKFLNELKELPTNEETSDNYDIITLGHNNPPAEKAIIAIGDAIPDIEKYNPNEEEAQEEKIGILYIIRLGLEALKSSKIFKWLIFALKWVFTRAEQLIAGVAKIANGLKAILDLIKSSGIGGG